MSSATRTLAGLGLLSSWLTSIACEYRETIRLDLSPPMGAASGVVSSRHDSIFEVYAFELPDVSELPVVQDIDHVSPLRFVARFYDQPLSELRLEPGRIPARNDEPEFGTVPYSDAFPEDRLAERLGGELSTRWEVVPVDDELSRFPSPRLPLDPDGCLDLELVASFVPGPGGRPSRFAALGADRGLVTFGQGQSEQVFEVREIEGTWQLSLLSASHPVSRIVAETGTLIMLAGDERGGYFVGTCTWWAETKTSTIWWAPDFDAPLEPIFAQTPGPECPESIVRVGADDLFVKRYGNTAVWLHPELGGFSGTELETCANCQDLFVDGAEVLVLGGDDQVYVYRDRQPVAIEKPPIDMRDAFAGFGRFGEDVVLVVRKEFAGMGNELYRRGPDGEWSLFARVNTPLASRVASLYDTIVFPVTYGLVRQFSHRHGLCEPTNGAATGLEFQTHFAKLDARSFLVGGYADQAHLDAPSRIAIVRARPRDRFDKP